MIDAMILKEFIPGCAMYRRDIVDALSRKGWAKDHIRQAMTRLRREGRIRYHEGHGFWSVPAKQKDSADV